MPRTTIGVDAGGTKITAALAQDGAIVRTARSDGANPNVAGIEETAGAIFSAIHAVAGDTRPDAIFVGAAGASRADVAGTIEALVSAGYPDAVVRVAGDAEIALRAAIPHGPGIVLIAGTGSVALACAHDGTLYRAGGYGYLLGDEGSAVWIGLQAARLLGRVYDGRAKGEETSALVARHLNAPDRAGLLQAAYGERFDLARFAALAPSIIAFAGKGNRASLKIVEEAAEALGDLVKDAARAALLSERPAVALSGGLMSEPSVLLERLEKRVAGDLPGAQIVRGADPVQGAIRCAEALIAKDS